MPRCSRAKINPLPCSSSASMSITITLWRDLAKMDAARRHLWTSQVPLPSYPQPSHLTGRAAPATRAESPGADHHFGTNSNLANHLPRDCHLFIRRLDFVPRCRHHPSQRCYEVRLDQRSTQPEPLPLTQSLGRGAESDSGCHGHPRCTPPHPLRWRLSGGSTGQAPSAPGCIGDDCSRIHAPEGRPGLVLGDPLH